MKPTEEGERILFILVVQVVFTVVVGVRTVKNLTSDFFEKDPRREDYHA